MPSHVAEGQVTGFTFFGSFLYPNKEINDIRLSIEKLGTESWCHMQNNQ